MVNKNCLKTFWTDGETPTCPQHLPCQEARNITCGATELWVGCRRQGIRHRERAEYKGLQTADSDWVMQGTHANLTTPHNPTHKASSQPYALQPPAQPLLTGYWKKVHHQNGWPRKQRAQESRGRKGIPKNTVTAINKTAMLELREQPPLTGTTQRDPGMKVTRKNPESLEIMTTLTLWKMVTLHN